MDAENAQSLLYCEKNYYKNWVAKGMVASILTAATASGILWAVVQFADLLTGAAKQIAEIILETLRVLKKSGTSAIHDLFTKGKYGNQDELLQKLWDMGYEKVELLDTTDGLFMTKWQSCILCLNGSALLVGKK